MAEASFALEAPHGLNILDPQLFADGDALGGIDEASFFRDRSIEHFNVAVLVARYAAVLGESEPERTRLPEAVEFGELVRIVVHASDCFDGPLARVAARHVFTVGWFR